LLIWLETISRGFRFAIVGGRNSFFNESIPFMALWALPEQFGASVSATYTNMGVKIED